MLGLRLNGMEVVVTLCLTSPAFEADQRVPDRFTCEGGNGSPPLSWNAPPSETRSFALVCSDPDAPAGTWYHWAVFDIPPERRTLEEDFPVDGRIGVIRQAMNDFGRTGYGGPCPPPGHGDHHYHFRLLALDVEHLAVAASPDCRDIEREAARHVLAETTLTGTFSRG